MSENSKARVPRPTVLVVGTLKLWEGHSNVFHKIRLLSESPNLDAIVSIREIDISINYASRVKCFSSAAAMSVKLLFGSMACIVSIVINRSVNSLYLPYPGYFILFLLSFLPGFLAPKYVVLDLFISLYDTVVHDRSLLRKNSFLAKLLYRFERRVLLRAQVCLVDTKENAHYYSKLFNLPSDRFKEIPLSIDNSVFTPVANFRHVVPVKSLRILFVGTMVPLQGISYVCECIRHLKHHSEYEFVLVGDGQDSPEVEALQQELKRENASVRLSWKREWMNSIEVSKEIGKADLCLGIFGNSAKADRVWPFKNYLYMACGKMLITAATTTAKRLTVNHEPAFKVVDTSKPDSLANAICHALVNSNQIHEYGACAREFYDDTLSPAVVSVKFTDLLCGGGR